MLSVSYAGKNVHSAGKTGALLRGDASGANRCYVVVHCDLGRGEKYFSQEYFSPFGYLRWKPELER